MPLKMNSNHLSVCSHLFVVTFSIVLIMLFSPWHIIFISPFKAPFLLDFIVVLFFPVSPHPTPTPTLLPTSVNNSSVCHVYTLPIHLPQISLDICTAIILYSVVLHLHRWYYAVSLILFFTFSIQH